MVEDGLSTGGWYSNAEVQPTETRSQIRIRVSRLVHRSRSDRFGIWNGVSKVHVITRIEATVVRFSFLFLNGGESSGSDRSC